MNEKIKKIFHFCLFLLITNLPFITIINYTGFDTFLDSFDNPSSYLYFDEPGKTINYNFSKGQYLLFQKSSHPDFQIEQKDVILYCKENGELTCHKVYEINSIGSINFYEIQQNENNKCKKTINENQIIGKVIKVIDGNIWNKLSINIWDTSIHNFNIKNYF